MTLTNRLSYFFLSMLAVVLLGFSFSLYKIVDSYLHQQAREQLMSVASSLGASVEVQDSEVEWEPNTRTLNFYPTILGSEATWIISAPNGQLVEQSKNQKAETLAIETSASQSFSGDQLHRISQEGSWLVSRQWIKPHKPATTANETQPSARPNRYAAISVTVGVSVAPIHETLNRLLLTLCLISGGIWIVAIVLSRYFCRRALVPVRQMAEDARELGTTDLSQRLAQLNSHDELQDLNIAFNGLLDRVQESFERQKKFTSDASHQLRTPLTAIQGQVEVALRRERTAEEYQAILSKVLLKSSHMTQIVESLLFLARQNADAVQPNVEDIELNGWTANYLSTFFEHPRAQNIHFEPNSAKKFRVRVPSVLLSELLNTLLDNAFKYSQPGRKVVVSIESRETETLLHVTDCGSGVSAADLPHLFTPFFRTDETIRLGIEGVGLGLSIAQRIATSIGAKLSVASKLNEGSCFTIHFPV